MEPRIQYAKTSDGVSIAYSVMGSGPLLIRAGHPWMSHLSQEWETFLPSRDFYLALAERLTVIRYDPRGCGMSDRHTLDFSLEARLRDLDAVVGAATTGQFAFRGSMGGCLAAIAYAVEHPERVSKLILIDPSPRWDRDNPVSRFMDALESISVEQWEAVTEALAGRIGQAGNFATLVRAAVSPEAFVAYRDATRQIDVTPLLSRISSPTLVIQHEGPLGSDHSREVASLIPGCQLVRTHGDRRLGPGPQEAAAVLDFLGAGGPAIANDKIQSPDVITVLWTDIVGHTEMMQRLGDEKGRAVLREHERITRDVLKAHGGTEVKTMGDGFMASFGSVTKAVECAVALQRAFDERNRGVGAPVEPLSIRVGLNAGEPIKEEGDLFGSTVILASRIAAKAEGGEILASDVVRGLCSGKGLLFADRGEFVAKGFEEPVRLWEVRWRE
jgi:class 3 adenylate cyclase